MSICEFFNSFQSSIERAIGRNHPKFRDRPGGTAPYIAVPRDNLFRALLFEDACWQTNRPSEKNGIQRFVAVPLSPLQVTLNLRFDSQECLLKRALLRSW